MTLITELKRRNVVKVGAAYLLVAWLVVQAASIGFPAFDAPPWALRVFILVLLLGFPIAVVMAWMFEMTPQGLKVEAAPSGNKRIFGIAVVLALLAIAWYYRGQPTVRTSAIPAGEVGAVAAPPAELPKSIAVLPFVNMSADAGNQFFSDGISEELLNVLVKVRGWAWPRAPPPSPTRARRLARRRSPASSRSATSSKAACARPATRCASPRS